MNGIAFILNKFISYLFFQVFTKPFISVFDLIIFGIEIPLTYVFIAIGILVALIAALIILIVLKTKKKNKFKNKGLLYEQDPED